MLILRFLLNSKPGNHTSDYHCSSVNESRTPWTGQLGCHTSFFLECGSFGLFLAPCTLSFSAWPATATPCRFFIECHFLSIRCSFRDFQYRRQRRLSHSCQVVEGRVFYPGTSRPSLVVRACYFLDPLGLHFWRISHKSCWNGIIAVWGKLWLKCYKLCHLNPAVVDCKLWKGGKTLLFYREWWTSHELREIRISDYLGDSFGGTTSNNWFGKMCLKYILKDAKLSVLDIFSQNLLPSALAASHMRRPVKRCIMSSQPSNLLCVSCGNEKHYFQHVALGL